MPGDCRRSRVVAVGGVWPRFASRPRAQASCSRVAAVSRPSRFSALVFMVVTSASRSGESTRAIRDQLRDSRTSLARAQYDVAGLWPRRAPIWLQIANWFEYADWQFALSLAPTVIPRVGTCGCRRVVFAALGLSDRRAHRRIDRRSWRAVMLLFVCGSLGVLVYLNLRPARLSAGRCSRQRRITRRGIATISSCSASGPGVSGRESARWCSRGVRDCRLAACGVGIALAALPIALNWTAVSRRSEPEASVPLELASELLIATAAAGRSLRGGRQRHLSTLVRCSRSSMSAASVTVVTVPLLGVSVVWRRVGERTLGLWRGATNVRAGRVTRIAGS